MQPREYGPLTADKTSYGSDRADGVLGGGHSGVGDDVQSSRQPRADPVQESHALQPTARGRPKGAGSSRLWTTRGLWTT